MKILETATNNPLKEFIEYFKKNRGREDLVAALDKLSGEKVLVVGDSIIDEYHYCQPLGMSAKENLISVNYESEDRFPGGAIATANHLAGFCREVGLFTLLGKKNTQEDFIRSHLKPNVRAYFVYRDDASTPIIRRYLQKVFLQKYLQLYFHNPVVPEDLDREVAGKLREVIKNYDIVLANDFGLGFLSDRAIKLLCGQARFLGVNTQTNSSNRGFNLITKYPRLDYGCVDEPEIRLATHDRNATIDILIRKIVPALRASHFAVTLGHRGSLVFDRRGNKFYETPVFSSKIVDRVGAGDAYFAITAPLVAVGTPTDLVGFIGNTMGAIAVTIVGNERSINRAELTEWMDALLS